MKIVCAPKDYNFAAGVSGDLNVILYGHADRPGRGGVGASAMNIIQHRKLQPAPRAWDLLSIAFAVVAADVAVTRSNSPDGWTREIDLHVAVSDPAFWQTQTQLLESQLCFLTTDLWRISFLANGLLPAPAKAPARPDEDSVVLLSGGLDSLAGAVDLTRGQGKKPYAVSQVALGDKHKQSYFAAQIGGLSHLQVNHNAECPGENERSQRARSIVFLALGALVGSALKRYHDGKDATLYVCENGFISINPPLTGTRLGSLSTRTTHPYFISSFQHLLDAAGLRIKIENPYQFKTKGEMLKGCADQVFLRKHAHLTTSCGRYARNGYQHCGRCLPCLIRRAAFHAWRVKDKTKYVYADLSRDDADHARFDDVRSAAMAVASVKTDGLVTWAGPSLSAALLGNAAPYRDVVGRGLDELRRFLKAAGVK